MSKLNSKTVLQKMKSDFSLGQRALTIASAPGRVNLIGEHTDYNGGYVLPLAISLQTHTIAIVRSDRKAYVTSLEIGNDANQACYTLGEETHSDSWVDYIQGVTQALQQKGHSLNGFELFIASTIPLGSGLSSSAALEVSVLRALSDLFKIQLDPLVIAQLAHQAETDFVGAKVGIMDQMAASLGNPKTALFLNTRTLHYEHITLPNHAEWLVINSGVTHSHASGAYNQRRQECTDAAERLGVHCLSDLSTKDLKRLATLPDPLARRARHVITENQRVIDAVQALRENNLEKLGHLFNASHASMRDDYNVSIPEIDFLVENLTHQPGIYGARLTGGGFGGCLVALAKPGNAREAAQRVILDYDRQFQKKAEILLS